MSDIEQKFLDQEGLQTVLKELPIIKDYKDDHKGYIAISTDSNNINSAKGIDAFAIGNQCQAKGNYSTAQGQETQAIGENSHAEGIKTIAGRDPSITGPRSISNFTLYAYSHAEGNSTTAVGRSSHAEGEGTYASGTASHTEGGKTTASGLYSHAEGYSSTASGSYAHAEGYMSRASGLYSHAEGYMSQALGTYSHSQGNQTIAAGNASFAGGYDTKIDHEHGFVFGRNLIVDYETGLLDPDEGYSLPQFVIGDHNQKDTSALFVIGGGRFFNSEKGDYENSNAFSVKRLTDGWNKTNSNFAITVGSVELTEQELRTLKNSSGAVNEIYIGNGDMPETAVLQIILDDN